MPSPENKNFNSQTSNPDSEEINLLDLLLVPAKRWKMIISVPFVVALITSVFTLFMPNIYTAKTMIVPNDNDSGSMSAMMAQLGGLASLAGGEIGSKTTSDLYVTMLKSETIMDPMIDKFKLMDLYKAKLRSNVYLSLGSITEVSLGKKDGVITIAVSEKDPKLAADLANEYVDQLGKMIASLSMAGAGSNRMFLEKRISEARTDLTKAEDDLKNFQSKNKSVSVTDQAQATIAAVAQMRAQLAVKEVELGTLQRQFTDASQEVKTVKAAIFNLRGQISALEGKGGASSSIPSVGSLPQLEQEYLRLMRELKIQETVLEMLTKQYEMAKLSEVKDTSSIQVLQKAKVPERKSQPRRSKIVIMTAIATGFFMVLVAFILHFIEHMSPVARARWSEFKTQLSNNSVSRE